MRQRKWPVAWLAVTAVALLAVFWSVASPACPRSPHPARVEPAALDAAMREHARNPIRFHLIPRVWGRPPAAL